MAVETSRRLRILEALKARVERIQIEHGYQTDLGKTVLLGVLPTFGPDDPDQVLAILIGEDQVGDQQIGKIPIVLPVNFAVLVKPDVGNPWVLVEQGLSDIKKAVESGDQSLGGLLRGGRNNAEGLMRGSTETMERRSGSEAIGALITYGVKYDESWARPEA
jgi:hypothetical protein